MTSNTSKDPDEIRADIEQTRSNLSEDVNALGEAVAPSAIARRQVDKVKGVGVGLKDKVMGTAEDAGSSLRDTTSGIGDTASGAPDAARSRVQGSPVVAGLVAFGIGWLAGSLLPSSQKEREAAAGVKEKAKPAMAEVKEVAQESAQNLQQPAKDAAEAVKSTAQDAAETVKNEGQQAASDVKDSAQDSADTVKEHQQRPDTSI